MVDKIILFVFSFCNKDSFSIFVILGATSSTSHLFVFKNWNWITATILFKTSVITNYDSSCWKIDSCGKCRGCYNYFQQVILESVFYKSSFVVIKPCMVKCYTRSYQFAQCFRYFRCRSSTTNFFCDLY